MTARYLIGDVLEVLPTLEDNSVDLILTSPPFLALRSYLPADHPDKAKEGGSQPTPGAFIDWLVDVVEALDRVLAPHGSMVIELGDTYAGPSGWQSAGDDTWSAGPDRMAATAWRSRPDKPNNGNGWPADKSLTLIPELFRMTLVYGFNPLTGRQTKRWRLRNVIRWVRPNPPVGALGDKFRPATSELVVFCRTDEAGRRRYFDLDAVREPHQASTQQRNQYRQWVSDSMTAAPRRGDYGEAGRDFNSDLNPAGAPPLDWWNIPLLDGEEETPYGPKPPQVDTGGGGYALRVGTLGGRDARNSPNNPAGAPPLDWWNIPLLDGEEPVKGGPKDNETRRREQNQRNLDRGGGTPGLKGPNLDRGDLGAGNFGSIYAGPPPLDWWNIPPGGFSGAHFATFPEALCVRPIKAMCPERVCRTCGEPSRRIQLPNPDYETFGYEWGGLDKGKNLQGTGHPRDMPRGSIPGGWSDCSHPCETCDGRGKVAVSCKDACKIDHSRPCESCGGSGVGSNYRPGLVLDPFAGSGTALAVAVGHGRDAVGIDLDERNLELARGRLGMFLEAAS